jgi:hypothetical protein
MSLDVMSARVTLRDRPLLDTLDLSVRFISSHARPYAWLALAVLLPAFLLTWAIGETFAWGWSWLCALAIAMLAEAPFTALASRLVFEEHVRARDALKDAISAVPRLIGASLIQLVAIGAGLLFLLLPAVWVAATLLFLPEVVVLERGSVGGSLGRAHRIVAGQAGDAMMTLLLLLALRIAMPFLADLAGRSILEDLLEIKAPEALTSSGGGPLALIGFWLFVPIAATARFLVYINLRTRVEGWDIQTRFAAIVRRAYAAGGER